MKGLGFGFLDTRLNTKTEVPASGSFPKVGSSELGWIIPGAVLFVSILLTWLLYRRFSRH